MDYHIDLGKAFDDASSDIEDVVCWCADMYDGTFGKYFQELADVSIRLKSKDHPITDEELSWILIQLPITLIDVSESVNRLRISQEVIKLRNRQIETQMSKDKIPYDPTADKLLAATYNAVITRVENEISFARELIMGAKKIWDSRRRTEQVNPVSEIDDNSLPNYTIDSARKRR